MRGGASVINPLSGACHRDRIVFVMSCVVPSAVPVSRACPAGAERAAEVAFTDDCRGIQYSVRVDLYLATPSHKFSPSFSLATLSNNFGAGLTHALWGRVAAAGAA